MLLSSRYVQAFLPAVLLAASAFTLHTIEHSRDREFFVAEQARSASTKIDVQLERILNLTQFCATASAITERWDMVSFQENCARQARQFGGWVVIVALGDTHQQLFNSRSDAPAILPRYPRGEEDATLLAIEATSRASGKPKIAEAFKGIVYPAGVVTAGQWTRLADGREAMVYVGVSARDLSRELASVAGVGDFVLALVDSSDRIVARSEDSDRYFWVPVPDWFLLARKASLPGVALNVPGPLEVGGKWDAGFHPIPSAPGWMTTAMRPTALTIAYWRLLSLNSGLIFLGIAISAGLVWFLMHCDRLSASLFAATQAKQLAEEKNREKSMLLSAFAHDVRAPLVSLIGTLALIEEKGKTSTADVRSAQSSAETLLQLVDDILELSYLGSGHFTLNNSPVDIRSLAEDLLAQIRPTVIRKGLGLHLDVCADLPRTVELDRLRLQQLLGNLLSNAVKYTDHGTVTLKISSLLSHAGTAAITFSIIDTGYGIESGQRVKIFKEFGRLERPVERREHGMGLGLAICRRILRAMGSELHLISEPGAGSTFFFTVVARVSLQGDPDRDVAPLAGIRILYVEDEPVIRKVTGKQLREAGASVVEAEDGYHALEKLADWAPDLLLVDLQMPGMDGVELVTRLNQTNTERTFPIFVLTSHISGQKAAEARMAGADVVFTKPVQILPLAAAFKARRGYDGRHTPSIGGHETVAGDNLVSASNFLLHVKSDKESLRDIYLPDFERSMRSDIETIRRLIATNDMTEIARIAHRALGVCQVLGASGLGDALQRLEDAVEGGSPADVTQICGALPFLLMRTMERMQSMLD